MWLDVVSCQVSGALYFSEAASVRQHYKSESPVTTRYHRDMTEKLLKGMLNPNKQQQHILMALNKQALSCSYLPILLCFSNMHSYKLWLVKRICIFEHSFITNFNCACKAIQRGQGSGFLSEGSSWLTACMREQRRFWRDCVDAQARLNLRCSHRR